MTKTKTWVEAHIKIDPGLADTVSNDIFNLGAEGFEEVGDGLKIYFTEDLWNPSLRQSLIDIISKFDPEFKDSRIHLKPVPFQNWNESWKENFQLFHLANKIIIKPDWDDYNAKDDEIVITISPKMAFGTGHHETTQLVLLALQKYIKQGHSLLDAGTGSGILSILAAKLGANNITAFDNDPIAIENARENFNLNKIKNAYHLFCGTLENVKKNEYDIIVANIDRNVLLKFPEKLIPYIKPGGTLILSGLLSRDEDKILTAYEEFDWQVIEKDQKGSWIVLTLTHS